MDVNFTNGVRVLKSHPIDKVCMIEPNQFYFTGHTLVFMVKSQKRKLGQH